jgi:pimeloyl-ACP methyl ester carboxylesterase
MLELRQLTTASGLRFNRWIEGPEDGPLVLLLHGFPQSRHTWRQQVPALAAAGYRAVAPDQRGYSPGARPDAADLANYRFDRLVADVLEIATACGRPDGRFHLVGHDWGGQVAWGLAHAHPQRLASLAILSRPHPAAFRRALDAPDGEQKERSRHHRAFLDPATAQLLLADDARRLRRNLAHAGVGEEAIGEYLSVLGNAPALEAALAWYRASPGLAAAIAEIAVPTLYLWGDSDQTVGRAAAEGTAEFVAAPFRFEVLPGVGHFVTDEAPERVTALLLDHLARFPAS